MTYIYEDVYLKSSSLERNKVIKDALIDYTNFTGRRVVSFTTKLTSKKLTEDLPIFWKFLSEHKEGCSFTFEQSSHFFDLDKASAYITSNYEVLTISIEEKE